MPLGQAPTSCVQLSHHQQRAPSLPGPRPRRFANPTPRPGLQLVAPAAGTHFAIDGDGNMPVIVAQAEIVGVPTNVALTTLLTWRVRLRFDASHCPHGPNRQINHPDIVKTAVGGTFAISFTSVRGGGIVDQCAGQRCGPCVDSSVQPSGNSWHQSSARPATRCATSCHTAPDRTARVRRRSPVSGGGRWRCRRLPAREPR